MKRMIRWDIIDIILIDISVFDLSFPLPSQQALNS